jgi:hypothetical protein
MMPPIHPLMAALIISYTQGQKVHQDLSSEKREKERLFHQKDILWKQFVSQARAVDKSKGILA